MRALAQTKILSVFLAVGSKKNPSNMIYVSFFV